MDAKEVIEALHDALSDILEDPMVDGLSATLYNAANSALEDSFQWLSKN